MRFSLVSLLAVALTTHTATAMPKPHDIMEALARRQVQAADGEQIDQQEPAVPALEDAGDKNERMIGDLRQGATTPVGQSIRNILLRTESAEGTNSRYSVPALLGTAKCKADTCKPSRVTLCDGAS